MALRRREVLRGKHKRFGLASLLGGVGVKDFHTFDPSRTYVAHGTLQRLTGLADLPELQSPGALINVWRILKVSAWPSATMQSPRSLQVLPEQLESAFRCGFTLYFRSVETNVPRLVPLARQLERDLFLAPGTITCEAFASSAGTGAKMHFDPNMTFNIQMLGHKTWRIAENQTVTNPHTGLTVGEEPSSDLVRYAHGPFPTSMPDVAMTFETEPGSVVYVPHGHWHTTEASEVSFAVLFTVCQENWMSLITKRISAQLRDREAWREIPIGMRASEFWKSRRPFVSELLTDLKRTIDSITPDDVMSALGGPFVLSYRVRDGIGFKVSRTGEPNNRTWTFMLSQNGKSASREIPTQLAAVFQWIAGNRQAFTGESAVKALPTVDPEFILNTLSELQARGVLQVASTNE